MSLRIATCALFLVATAACYRGLELGSVDSGLPPDTLGSALTDVEAAALCQARDQHFAELVTADDLHNYACVLQASFAPDCPTAYDACIRMEYVEDPPATCSLTFDLATCNASVADIEACLSAINIRNSDYFKSVSCTGGDPGTGTAVPPACSEIAAICPGIG